MSCTSDRLLDNIKWRLETMTTHTDTDHTLKGFVYYEPSKLGGDLTPGMTRGFSLQWERSRSDEGVMDLVVQQAEHDVILRVIYYKHNDTLSIQRLLLRDRFDIVKLLRNPDNWVGYVENPTAGLQIDKRFMVDDELIDGAHAFYLMQRWRHYMIEAEQ